MIGQCKYGFGNHSPVIVFLQEFRYCGPMKTDYTDSLETGLEFELAGVDATLTLGRELGRVLARQASLYGALCLLFFGELGAGKTTLTRGLVAALPGGENAEVSSPSFTLYNVYPTTPSVLHCDLYRSEFGSLPDEVAEALDADNGLILVEWAERIADEDLPPKRLDIRFRPCNNNRLVTLEPRGEAACSVLRELTQLRGLLSEGGVSAIQVMTKE